MLHKTGLRLFLTIFLCGFSAVGAKATNLIVTVADDPTGTGNCASAGSCSLRQAISTAASGDAIFFNLPAANCPNGVCTVSLLSGLTVNKSLSFFGPGLRNLIIKPSPSSGLPAFNVLSIIGPNFTTINVNMIGLTISGGYNSTPNPLIIAGGVTIGSANVNLNYVGIINNGGDLAGGIYCQQSNLTITNSLIANNTGKQGGGIYNLGITKIVNSTISGNSATTTVANQISAGGILNDYIAMGGAGNLTLINSTVANNSSQSPFASSGGGVVRYTDQTIADVRNSIIAGNTSSNGNNDVAGFFLSRGNNLIANTTGSTGFGFGGSNDIVNQSANLAPLADNGGQSLTHALLAGSPAINAGNDCVLNLSCAASNPPQNLEFDQRGQPFARKSGAAVDIGAFELQIRKTPFDFDGDGKADVAVARNNDGNLTWYLLNSQTGFTAVTFGIGTDRIVPADYDGDGKTDVAVFRSGTWYIQQSTLGFTGIAFGASDDVPVPADYDGDGKADVAVFRPGTGVWYLQRSTLGFTGITFGQAGDKPVAADYDGDGKTDVAVNRNGTWYLQRSTLGFTGIAFGDSNDKLVPADYDGDGVADIAVFRPSNGAWYVQRSQLGFTGIAFGSSTDLPVPADYDGDGKTDVAVTRANGSALTWYLLRSQDGFTGVGFGTSTDRAVENAYIP